MSAQEKGLDSPRDRPLDRLYVGQGRIDPAKTATPRFLGEWGKEGSEPGEFHFPIGIAINAADEVFVTDFYNARVQKFSVDGKLLAVIPVLPNPAGSRSAARATSTSLISRNRRRRRRKTDRISVYDRPANASTMGQDAAAATANSTARAASPSDRTAGSSSRTRPTVASRCSMREGKFLSKWGEHGSKPGQFGGKVFDPVEGGRPAVPGH